MVPKGWSIHRIEEVLEKVSEPISVSADATYQEIGIRSHGKGIFHKEPVRGTAIGEKRVFKVVPDCLVLNIVFAWEQAVARTTTAEVGMIASHRFPQYRPKLNKCSVDYMLYLFKTKQGKELLKSASPGGAGRNKTLGQKEFGKLKVLLPPIEEQDKIVESLRNWDHAIEITTRLLDKTRQQRQSLMRHLFKHGRDLGGNLIPFRKYQLKDLCEIDARSLNSQTSPDFDFEYISLSDVGSGIISESLTRCIFSTAPSRARKLLKEGDILLATVRPNLQGFARVGPRHAQCIASTGFAVLSPNESIDGDYLYHYLYSEQCTKQLNALVVGSSYPAINSSDVGNLLIAIPDSRADQRRIANILNNCERALNTLSEELLLLSTIRTTLMQQVLSGKLRFVNQTVAPHLVPR